MDIHSGLEWNCTMDTNNSDADILTFNESFLDWYEDPSELNLPHVAQAVLITLYTITITLSVTGNLLVIIVLASANRTRTEITVFLINLAVADLFMACFCMPFSFTQTMLGRWVFPQFMCPLVLFMQVNSVAVSIFTNVAIGIDRFWGVVFPLRPRITRTMAKVVLVVIWLLATSLASVQLVVSRSEEHDYFGIRYYDCQEKWSHPRSRTIYTLVISLTTYFIPILSLTVVYSRIGSILWTRKTPGNADGARDKILLKSKRKVVKMVITLVVAFAICWLPLHLFNIVLDFAPHIIDHYSGTKHDEYTLTAIFCICHWMAMANSFTNPIIFSFLNDNFRADMKSVLQCHFRVGRFTESNRVSIPSTHSIMVRIPRQSKSKSQTSHSDSHQSHHSKEIPDVQQPINAICNVSRTNNDKDTVAETPFITP